MRHFSFQPLQYPRLWHRFRIEEPELNSDLVGYAKNITVDKDITDTPWATCSPQLLVYPARQAAQHLDSVQGCRAGSDVADTKLVSVPRPEVDQIRG